MLTIRICQWSVGVQCLPAYFRLFPAGAAECPVVAKMDLSKRVREMLGQPLQSLLLDDVLPGSDNHKIACIL